MSDKKTPLEEATMNLRSVLISSKEDITTRKLLSDYQEIVCTPLPFRELGFRTAEDFLHSIPSVVTGRRTYAGMTWTGVADKNTMHVAEMVSQQRSKGSRNNRPVMRRRPPAYPHSAYNRPAPVLPPRLQQTPYFPHQMQPTSLFSSGLLPTPTYYRMQIPSLLPTYTPQLPWRTTEVTQFHNPTPQPKVKTVPAPLKGQIEALLGGYPGGIKMSEFADVFKERFHQCLIPADFGYGSVNDFVLSMPETIRVRNTGRELVLFATGIPDSNLKKTEFNRSESGRIATGAVSNSKEVNGWQAALSSQEDKKRELVDSARVYLKEERKDDCKNNLGFNGEVKHEYKPNSTENCSFKHDYKPNSTENSSIKHDYKPNLTQNSSIKQVESENKSRESKENEKIQYTHLEEKENVNSNTSMDAYKQIETFAWQPAREKKSWVDSDIEDDQNCAVSKRLKMEFRQLLEKYPKQIKSNFLPTIYAKEFKKELDYQALGYISLTDLVFDIPDIFFPFRESPNSDYLLLDARACKKYGCPSFTAQGCQTKKIPEVIKKAVVKLLYNKSNGILVHDFQEEYKQYFNRKLPYADYGFYNVRDFLDDLANDTIGLDDTINGTVARLRPDSLHKYLPALGGKPEMAVLNLLPNDFVKFGEEIPLQTLPEKSTETYFEVIPSDITSPDEFYFYLRGKETSMALETLMNSLEFYHSNAGSDYIIPPTDYQTNQIGAALYDNKDWHRVKILQAHEEDVTVFYMDYGTIGKALKKNMRLLKTRFATLPAQAIEAKLWDLKPVLQTEWSIAGRQRFYNLVENRVLAARVMGSKIRPITKAKVLGLWLVDTCRPSEKELHINKLLVDEGHACYFDETRAVAGNGDMTTQFQMLNMCNPSMLCPLPTNILEFQAAYVNNMCAMMMNCNQILPQMYYQTQQTQTTTTKPESAAKPVEPETRAEEIVPQPIPVRINSGLDNLDDLLDELSVKRFVKVVTICSHTIHLILFSKELYVMAKEISQFLWPRDLLRIKLRLHHLKIPKVMINEEDYPELFSELFNYNVCEAPLEPGQPHALNIYPFNRVPEIIDKFNPSLTQLKDAVIQELDRFDPNDTYWGNSDDGISVCESWDVLDEVKVGLEVIKARKDAIERELLGGTKQPLVDELDFLNGRILMLESGKFK